MNLDYLWIDPGLQILDILGAVVGGEFLKAGLLAFDDLKIIGKSKGVDKTMGEMNSDRFHVVVFAEFVRSDFFVVEIRDFVFHDVVLLPKRMRI